MKMLALRMALATQQAEVKKNKDIAYGLLKKALTIPSIEKARTAYINAMFDSELHNKKVDVEMFHEKYCEALAVYGYEESDFTYQPKCAKCEDKGMVGSVMCDCIKDLYIQELKKLCNIDALPIYDFADSNLQKVKDTKQREQLDALYKYCERFANAIPNTKYKTLVLYGDAGTGKTCLATAIVRKVLDKGYSVKCTNSFEFVQDMLSSHTAPSVDEKYNILNDYLRADVLFIDDLGTETMLKNVTIEYFLYIVEQRLLKNKYTIITTNLTPDKFVEKYGDRLHSRLANTENSKWLAFSGDDLRQTK